MSDAVIGRSGIGRHIAYVLRSNPVTHVPAAGGLGLECVDPFGPGPGASAHDAAMRVAFYIRFGRAEVDVRRSAGGVEAARACGDSHLSVVLRVLLPNVLRAMAVQMSLNRGWAILNAAGLSFIGLGVRSPTPEWGIMVAEGARFITTGKWWLIASPGLALMLAVLCFNLLGDGLRDILDPRLRT